MNLRALLAAALCLALVPSAHAADKVPVDAGPYVPSPSSVVSDMLTLAEVGPKDFVIDLGSGDGRIVLTAAKVFGARGFGVEIKEKLVKEANEAARLQGIADRASFTVQDLFKTDIRQATVLTMYLLPNTVNMLKDKLLAELNPGTRIISHDYPLSGWLPEKYEQFDLADKVQISGVTTTIIYLYIVPAQVAGRWSATLPANVAKGAATLEIKQQMQNVSGNLKLGSREVPLQEMKLVGDRISFALPGERGARTHAFTGQVNAGSIEGFVESAGVKTPWSAKLAPKS